MSTDFWLYVVAPLAFMIAYCFLQGWRQRSKARSFIIMATFLLGALFMFGDNYVFIIIGTLMLVLDIWETKPKVKYITPRQEAL